MKIKFISKPILGHYENKKFTHDKEYEVLADYRQRHSCQSVKDNGFVIQDDTHQNAMVFLDEFTITCNEKGNTYIFSY